MKSNIKKNLLFSLISVFFISCSADKDMGTDINPVKTEPFDIQEHFIAGTLGTGNNKNVIVIRFLDKEKAIFSQNYVDLVARYSFSDKKNIIVEVKEDANYRVMKFELNDENQIIYGYYQALTQVSVIDVSLVKIPENNQFEAATFKGTESVYVGYTKLDRPVWYYKFDEKGTKFGTDSDVSSITPKKRFELINNAAFKFFESNTSSTIGFINSEGKLIVSGRDASNSFLGTYEKQ